VLIYSIESVYCTTYTTYLPSVLVYYILYVAHEEIAGCSLVICAVFSRNAILLCYYATMLLCYYATMLLCHYATMLLCYYATMPLC
jgi:hypothetical protein